MRRENMPDDVDAEGAPLPRPVVPQHGVRCEAAVQIPAEEALIEELPVALVYNGISHAVMLATPTDLTDFALGFSLAEGILEQPSELYDCEVISSPLGLELHLEIATARMHALQQRKRSLAGRSGCGLCGIDSLSAAQALPGRIAPPRQIPRASLATLLDRLQSGFPLHATTGAAHAAVWLARDAKASAAREDVGRHNALDKLIGGLHRQSLNPADGMIAVTSRASVELVQKAARAGVPLLAAVSAPTAAAVRLADACGMTLVAWAREQRFTVYAHPEYLEDH